MKLRNNKVYSVCKRVLETKNNEESIMIFKKALIDYILDTTLNIHYCIQVFEKNNTAELIGLIPSLMKTYSNKIDYQYDLFLKESPNEYCYSLIKNNDDLRTKIHKIKSLIYTNNIDVCLEFFNIKLNYNITSIYNFMEISNKKKTYSNNLIKSSNDNNKSKNNSNIRVIISCLFTYKHKPKTLSIRNIELENYKTIKELPSIAYEYPIQFKFTDRIINNNPTYKGKSLKFSIHKKISKNVYYDNLLCKYIYLFEDYKKAYEIMNVIDNYYDIVCYKNKLNKKMVICLLINDYIEF